MKAIKTLIDGREHFLYYNAEAMFALKSIFGEKNLIEAMAPGDAEGYSATLETAFVLAEQGELARRALGYDKNPLLTPQLIRAAITPMQVVQLKQDVFDAIDLGLHQDIEATGKVVDLGLEELQKKTS
ncbi:MAG: hypothetical protein RR394_10210 [Oscillospiraceae bacterium]